MSSSDRRPYLTATVLDQAFLDFCHDNLENRLEMVCDIEDPFTPGSYLRISDRNKYVDSVFYEALAVFPVINRTVGEWLSPEIQFSTLTIEISNVDGRFNKYLPGGVAYGNWVGRSVMVRLGLRDVSATYTTVFNGRVTDIGGIKRSVKSFTLIARDDYDKLSVNFPNSVLSAVGYPMIADDRVGTVLPVIYGDWTVNLDPGPATVKTFPTNTADPNVIGGALNPVQLRISLNNLFLLDQSNVYLRRGDINYIVPATEIVNVSLGNNQFEVTQNNAGALWITEPTGAVVYIYETGDEFYVRVKGEDLGIYSDNMVHIARHIGLTYGGLIAGDFHSNWDTYRDKAAPAQSAIVNIKARVWENEPKPVIQYMLSMLEQVRLEAFVDRDLKIKINALHFEDFDATPTNTVKNWDIVKDTFSPRIDERNNFNRAQGAYDFHPDVNDNAKLTPVLKNAAAITQVGKEISKKIVFPNLYIESDVTNQLTEIIRIASSGLEVVEATLTWRSLLRDIGEFISVDIDIGSTIIDDVPHMIRSIGYDPAGLKIPVQLWSFQICPFPGYVPGYAGTVGGYNGTITVET